MASKRFSRLINIVTGAKTGAGEELPLLESELTKLEHFAHFWVLVAKSFVRNRCLVRASALSFSSMLALIPMLAVAISVVSSLLKTQGEEQIYSGINKFVTYVVPPGQMDTNHPNASINLSSNLTATVIAGLATNAAPGATNAPSLAGTTNFPGETNVVIAQTTTGEDSGVITAQKEAARYIHEFIQKTQSSTLGVVSLLLLLYVAISMLANIEATFNDIWGVPRGRSWFRRLVLYWFTLTLGPILLVGASSLAGSSHLQSAHQFISGMPVFGNLIFKLLPVVILWIGFSFIYLAVPHTKVRFSSALVGGILAGTLWHLNNVFGYLYVSRLSTNNTFYASLGLVPVFMAGLYLTWVILLFGAQVSYAFQNRKSYLQDKFAENVNQRGREFIAFRVMTCLGLRYQNGQAPATTDQIAMELGISSRLTLQIIQTLLAARLITEVAGPEAAYCPARPLEAINAHQVLMAMRCVNKPEMFTREEPVRDEIYGEFARIEEAERVAASAVTMLALVNRARARLETPALARPEKLLVLAETATPLVAPEPSETVAPVEVVVDEFLVAPEPVAAPVKPARKIVVPEDNYDFPL